MKVLIVDDETPARERLRALLAEVAPQAQIVAEASDGVEAVLACQAHRPDLVLLDIRMPRMDGLEAARAMAQDAAPPAVVFVTAYDEHALAAFDLNAVDYLLKPVRKERLAQALAKLQSFGPERWQRLAASLPASARSHFCVKQHGGVLLIPATEVRCCLADMKYTTLFTATQQALIEDTLKTLEQEFQHRWMRVHRSALVALDHVTALEKSPAGCDYLRLEGIGQPIEVSRRHSAEVRRRLREYRGRMA